MRNLYIILMPGYTGILVFLSVKLLNSRDATFNMLVHNKKLKRDNFTNNLLYNKRAKKYTL